MITIIDMVEIAGKLFDLIDLAEISSHILKKTSEKKSKEKKLSDRQYDIKSKRPGTENKNGNIV